MTTVRCDRHGHPTSPRAVLEQPEGAAMSRTSNKIIRSLPPAIVVAIAIAAIPAQVARAATVPCSVPALVTAINAANSKAGDDTINLARGCTYTLVAPDNAANGLPVITSNITINGHDATITRAPSAPSFRILAVASAGTLTLHTLTISGGKAPDCPSPFPPPICGGGISNLGTLTINNSQVVNNTATSSTNGISVEG